MEKILKETRSRVRVEGEIGKFLVREGGKARMSIKPSII